MSKEKDKVVSVTQAVLLLMLLIYLAFWSAKLIWMMFTPDNSTPIMLPAKVEVTKSNVVSRASQLPRYHLFGEVGAQIKKVEDKPKAAPKTNLRLVLKGVFTSTNASSAGAIIEEIGKKADYYGVGDKVPGNAVLEEVYSDRVLLNRNGRLETLAFAEKKSNKDSQSIAKVSKPKPKAKKSSSSQVVETPEQFIGEATRRLAENPEQALGSVGLKASDSGYVYQGGNPMLAGLNLKKGDVIRSVNGHALGDVQKDKALMQSLYEQGSLEVEVERNGASFYINYPLR